MNLAKLSVTRPVAVTMRIAALVLLGFVCFYRLPVDLLPAVSLPTVAVITQWPNVAPEELETQITRPIEQAVNSAPNIYQVSSSTVTGVSTVRVQFNWGTDIGQGGGRRFAAGGARPPEVPHRSHAANAHRVQIRPVPAAHHDLWRVGRTRPGETAHPAGQHHFADPLVRERRGLGSGDGWPAARPDYRR